MSSVGSINESDWDEDSCGSQLSVSSFRPKATSVYFIAETKQQQKVQKKKVTRAKSIVPKEKLNAEEAELIEVLRVGCSHSSVFDDSTVAESCSSDIAFPSDRSLEDEAQLSNIEGGEQLMRENRYHDALLMFETLIEVFGHQTLAAVFVFAIECCFIMDTIAMRERSVSISFAFTRLHPREVQSHVYLIKGLMRVQRLDDAIYVATCAQKMFPSSSLLYNLRGHCYHSQKKYKISVADFHKATELARIAMGKVALPKALKSWRRTSPF